MRTALEILIVIFILFILWIGLAKLTRYEERMKEYNKYICAVNGYEEDCKTPLPEERKLK